MKSQAKRVESYHHQVPPDQHTNLRAALTDAVQRRHRLSHLSQVHLRAWILGTVRAIRKAEWPDLDQRPGHYYVSCRDPQLPERGHVLVSGPYPSHRIAKMWQWPASQTAGTYDSRAAFYAFGTARLRDGQPLREAMLQKWGYSLDLKATP